MAPSVVDFVRNPPPPAATPAPKPSHRFDDVLASRRDRVKPQPKPDDASAKKAEPRKPTEPKPANEADDTAEREATETEASEETDKAENDKPVKKTAGKKKADDAESDGEADVEATDDTDTTAGPVMTLLPVDAPVADEEAIEVEDGKTPAVPEVATDVAGEAAALAAQLATVTPTAPVSTDVSAETAPTTETVAAPIDATAAKPLTLEELAAQTAAPEAADGTEAGKAELKRPQANAGDADASAEAAVGVLPDVAESAMKPVAVEKEGAADALQALVGSEKPAAPAHTSPLPAAANPAAVASPRNVAEENVDRIVTSIRGEILNNGGTMQIRLDPPTLGSINVQISVDDGVMSASLQTSNDEATRLLSHNLSQLKNSLEAAGVTVDRIQVKQAAPAESSNNSQQQTGDGDRQQQSNSAQDQSARQEQQRREMLQRMWAKLSGNGDPLDLVA
ncbi:MAG TPA: flagellar hook-length control protein FliK [Tepidisphaeraceae bacterium]|jgi:flagellar hook-length control protein FliK